MPVGATNGNCHLYRLSESLMFGNLRCGTLINFSQFGYVDLEQLAISPAKMGLLCNNKELQFGPHGLMHKFLETNARKLFYREEEFGRAILNSSSCWAPWSM